MPLMLTTETEGLTRVGGHDVAAHVRCDHCGEPLHPEAGGRVVWPPDRTERYLAVAFLHRSCVDGYEEEAPGDLEGMDLGRFLATLIHNLEVAG